jgi:hypothetical protein
VSYASPYPIPDRPPADLVAELDRTAQALDALTARAAELTLGMDPEAGGLRIVLCAGGIERSLSPTELFELLAGA